MNMQWTGGVSCPIVEFHELSFVPGGAERYLALLDGELSAALMALGGRDFGHYHHGPDRLVIVRGFPSVEARRRTLGAFYAGAGWERHGPAATQLVVDHQVMLTRIVAPAAGLTTLRPGHPYALLVSELRYSEAVGSYHLWLRLLLRKAGLDPVAAFATLEAENGVRPVPVVRNRTHHLALVAAGGSPPLLPPELAAMVRQPLRQLALRPALSLVW